MRCYQIGFLGKQSTISLYWKCQFLFWGTAALYWLYIGYSGTGFSWLLGIAHFITDLFIYIIPTHLFRQFSLNHGWQKLDVSKLLGRIAASLIVLASVFMILTISKNYLFRVWFQPGFNESFQLTLATSWVITLVTGFRLMAIWLLAYYGFHYAQREINAVKEAARLQIIAKDAAFNNLSAQLNPHFFFNSLNSIKALVIENPQAARRAIDILSELLRTSLYAKEETLVTLKEELSLVNDYLELEKIRFEEKLCILFEVDEQLMDKMILRLSIQTLVENAIKHGISKSGQGGFIKVKVQQNLGQTEINVENTGKLNGDLKSGLGLDNLTERLKLQFGNSAVFELEQYTEQTALATIKTPLL